MTTGACADQESATCASASHIGTSGPRVGGMAATATEVEGLPESERPKPGAMVFCGVVGADGKSVIEFFATREGVEAFIASATTPRWRRRFESRRSSSRRPRN
jgi:uncharacterized protein YbjT (DUF2867 family)